MHLNKFRLTLILYLSKGTEFIKKIILGSQEEIDDQQSKNRIWLYLKKDSHRCLAVFIFAQGKKHCVKFGSEKNDIVEQWCTTSGQFHQHFTCAFFIWKCFLPKSFCQSRIVTREKLRKAFLYKNACVKCWWNWPQGSAAHQGAISSTFYERYFADILLPKCHRLYIVFRLLLLFY